jgi:hypothetical protein
LRQKHTTGSPKLKLLDGAREDEKFCERSKQKCLRAC